MRALDGGVPCMIDRTAIDTVGNFTTLAGAFAAAGVTSVAVATDAAHQRRAHAVGRVILGVYGVRVRALTVALNRSADAPTESWLRVLRDVLRALLWACLGLDGRSLAALVYPRRAADARAWREAEGCCRGEAERHAALVAWMTAALAV